MQPPRPGRFQGQRRALILGHPLLYLQVCMAVFGATPFTPDPVQFYFALVGVDGPPPRPRPVGLSPASGLLPRSGPITPAFFFDPLVFSHLAWGTLALLLLVALVARGR